MFKRTVAGRFVRHPSSWRRMAPAMWEAPSDPTMHGTLEIDVTKALEYLQLQSEISGTHLTITHLVVKAVADTLAQHPECNAFIRRGRVSQGLRFVTQMRSRCPTSPERLAIGPRAHALEQTASMHR